MSMNIVQCLKLYPVMSCDEVYIHAALQPAVQGDILPATPLDCMHGRRLPSFDYISHERVIQFFLHTHKRVKDYHKFVT